MINVTIEDLAIAYKKAKVDLWYSGSPCRKALVIFEDNLLDNFKEIINAFANGDKKYFLGISEGYLLCPKKIGFSDDEKENINGSIISDPDIKFSIKNVKNVDLRIVANVPIAFHVVTALWINKIGERFDKILSSSVYGNRIRRHDDKTINLLSLGTFKQYLHPYRMWRDNGLKAIRTALEEKKEVVAITGDFTAFYHNINADFIISDTFLNKAAIELSEEEKAFTKLIVDMLTHWAKKTPLNHGLPVGCAISNIIANAALLLFDEQIEKEIIPLYYGRYVDDIILVFENTNKFNERDDVWEWIIRRIPILSLETTIDKTVKNNVGESRIRFDLTKLLEIGVKNDSQTKLYFEKNKTKVFILNPPSGLAFLDTLERQIKEQSSEWRSLPELPDETHIASMLLSACDKSGEVVDNLRKADSLSMCRAMFAMKIRDFESYARSLPPESWKKQRQAFLKTIDLYFTNLKYFFDLFRYFPRILSIAIEGGDFEYVISIVKKIHENCKKLLALPCTISGKVIPQNKTHELFRFFENYINYSFSESIVAALVFPVSDRLKLIFEKCPWLEIPVSIKDVQKLHRDFSGYDLANKPFRYFSFYKEVNWSFGQSGTWATFFYRNKNKRPAFLSRRDFIFLLWLSRNCINNLRIAGIPRAWIFPTRPFSMPELYLCVKNAFDHYLFIARILNIFRGYAMQREDMPCVNLSFNGELPHSRILEIQDKKISSPVKVALTSWKTEKSSWIASICKKDDPDVTRYSRLSHLLNQILKSHEFIDYVVFPELSIPVRWFLGMARKLTSSGISLIGGVEYIHPSTGVVHNQVWCSLVHDGLGFPQSVIIMHDKEIPALHEKEDLKRIGGVQLVPENYGQTCNIIQHGNFFFGLLICSELTNINYRAELRGLVDAIFVPEWNSDVEMFGSLIEAAAYDVHAYIIQCNNRRYGDTRIRIPAKDHYHRDVVRVKGGEADFFVIGKLNIDELRKFQSFHISPTADGVLFKPVPIGFTIASYRKTLPGGEENIPK